MQYGPNHCQTCPAHAAGLRTLLPPHETLDTLFALLTPDDGPSWLHFPCCPGKWMVVIPPLIILVSQEPGLLEMDENTFCRTEHSGTGNWSLLPKAQNLWFLNPISKCFLPYTLRNKIQTNNGNAYVWWIEKRLHSDSDFPYLRKNIQNFIKSACYQCCVSAPLLWVGVLGGCVIVTVAFHIGKALAFRKTE